MDKVEKKDGKPAATEKASTDDKKARRTRRKTAKKEAKGAQKDEKAAPKAVTQDEKK